MTFKALPTEKQVTVILTGSKEILDCTLSNMYLDCIGVG